MATRGVSLIAVKEGRGRGGKVTEGVRNEKVGSEGKEGKEGKREGGKWKERKGKEGV